MLINDISEETSRIYSLSIGTKGTEYVSIRNRIMKKYQTNEMVRIPKRKGVICL